MDNWVNTIVQSVYDTPSGCWVDRKTKWSYSYEKKNSDGYHVLKNGDGSHLVLTDEEFRKQMCPT